MVFTVLVGALRYRGGSMQRPLWESGAAAEASTTSVSRLFMRLWLGSRLAGAGKETQPHQDPARLAIIT